jgi:hypothetical protein
MLPEEEQPLEYAIEYAESAEQDLEVIQPTTTGEKGKVRILHIWHGTRSPSTTGITQEE